MSNSLAIVGQSPPEDLLGLDRASLRAELARSLAMTAAHLMRTAWVVRLLEEQGDDLSDLRIGLLDYLRRIAYGQVSPDLVVRYSQTPGLMRTLTALPLPDQNRIASGEPVTVVVRREDGVFDKRLADPLKLTKDQVSQVFARGRIRDEAEQILLLEDSRPKEASRKIAHRRAQVKVDRERGGLVIGRKFFAAGDVVSALAELIGEPDDSPAEIAVPVKLTEAEHIALKNAATRSGSTMSVLIRRALMVSGLFSGE